MLRSCLSATIVRGFLAAGCVGQDERPPLALTSPITPEHVHVELVYGHMDVNTMTHMIRSALIKDPRSPNALVYAITNAQTVMDA